MRFLALPLLISALTALSACSSAPDIQPEERPTLITLKDHRTGMDLFLANEAHTDRVEYYSQERNSASLKVVPNLDMGALMMQLTDYGFFDHALPQAQRVRGARTTLLVEIGEQKYTLAMTTDDPGGIERAVNCNNAFRALYNAHFSMQLIDNPNGKALFENQQRQLGRSNTRTFR